MEKMSIFNENLMKLLGYIIEEGGIKPSEDKVRAVKMFPSPQNKKSLQRFLGLTSYFRRFVEGYAVIARPLSTLLRKDEVFRFAEEQQLAFEQLKSALTKAPVLKLYDAKAETEIHTDASKHGYGGVLLQKDPDDQQFHPIQFISRKTRPEEEKYHSYELEVLAIIQALKKWRIYVIDKRFKIVSDCNAFALTMKKKDVPLRVSRWAMYLQDFDYVTEHRPATKMKHVDALSRMTAMLLEVSLSFRLREAQQSDNWVRAISKVLENNPYEDFYIKNSIVYKDPINELVVVPQAMEEEIIRIAHRQGHWATQKTQDYGEKSF
uniref:Retrotransposable element Tf2 155 kDa protein type 3 n=1 Tax=Ceratitis capitata TaxID=7213 RepID=W8B0Q9_CERCA